MRECLDRREVHPVHLSEVRELVLDATYDSLERRIQDERNRRDQRQDDRVSTAGSDECRQQCRNRGAPEIRQPEWKKVMPPRSPQGFTIRQRDGACDEPGVEDEVQRGEHDQWCQPLANRNW